MTTDQSHPVSRAFTSRLREVLTARLPQGPGWVVWVDGVVEELAAGCVVEDPRLAQIRALMTEPGADGIYRWKVGHVRRRIKAILDAVSVDVTPAQDIDREKAREALDDHVDRYWHGDQDDVLDALAECVRPVEGIVLSPEEVRLLVSTLSRTDEWHAVHFAALAARFEALS